MRALMHAHISSGPVFRPCNLAQTNIQREPETGHREAAKLNLICVSFTEVRAVCVLLGICVCNHMSLMYLLKVQTLLIRNYAHLCFCMYGGESV